jgi:hypothetical protein
MAQPTEHPTNQLQFVEKVSHLRTRLILQQRWLIWDKGEKARYEWRDVPIAKEGIDAGPSEPPT